MCVLALFDKRTNHVLKPHKCNIHIRSIVNSLIYTSCKHDVKFIKVNFMCYFTFEYFYV